MCGYQSTNFLLSRYTSIAFCFAFLQSTYVGQVGAHQCHLSLKRNFGRKIQCLKYWHTVSYAKCIRYIALYYRHILILPELISLKHAKQVLFLDTRMSY